MRRLMFSLSATAALLLCGAAFSVAQATPLVSFISIQFTALLANRKNWLSTRRRCPYGKRIVRHSGHGPTCEPCESKKDEYREAPPKGKSSSQKEESSGGRNPSGSSHYDEDRGDTTDRMKATLMELTLR